MNQRITIAAMAAAGLASVAAPAAGADTRVPRAGK